MLNTRLHLKAGVVVAATVLVDGGNREGVDGPTFQVGYAAGGGGAATAGVMASSLLGLDGVTEGSV